MTRTEAEVRRITYRMSFPNTFIGNLDPRHFRRRTSSSSRKVLRALARALKISGMTEIILNNNEERDSEKEDGMDLKCGQIFFRFLTSGINFSQASQKACIAGNMPPAITPAKSALKHSLRRQLPQRYSKTKTES